MWTCQSSGDCCRVVCEGQLVGLPVKGRVEAGQMLVVLRPQSVPSGISVCAMACMFMGRCSCTCEPALSYEVSEHSSPSTASTIVSLAP